MFGDQGITKLNNKKSVQLFMKFLSDLVPYEPAEYLKVTCPKRKGQDIVSVLSDCKICSHSDLSS